MSRVFRVPTRRSGRESRGATPIGLEVTPTELRLAQLDLCGGGLRQRAAAVVPVSDPEALPDALRRALRAGRFRGRRVVAALPDAGTRVMVLNYTAVEGQSEPETILGLVRERIEGPVEEFVIDYVPIRTSEDSQGARSALVAVARHADAVAFLDRVRDGGLEIDALEIAPVAVHRLLAWLGRGDLSSHTLMLRCGAKHSDLLVQAGRRLVLYREIAFGEESVAETIGKALDLPRDEALGVLERFGVWPEDAAGAPDAEPAQRIEIASTLREVLKPVAYLLLSEVERAGVYTASQWRGATFDRLCLLGRFVEWPGFDRLVENLVSIPTECLDPVEALFDASPPAESVDADLSVAIGLALRGASPQ